MAFSTNFTVLGSGNGGRALCALIAGKGFPVTMYEPLEESEDYKKIKTEKELFLEGNIQTGGTLKAVTMDIKEATENSDIILVAVPSFAHRPIFEKLLPHLRDGHAIVLIPGNYGGFLLKKMMEESGIRKDITVSETSTLPFACRITSYNTIRVFKKKNMMKIATSPAEKNGKVIEIMNEVFRGTTAFTRGENLLEMDLDNINQPLHPLPVLLNYGTIEKNPETFRHYIDGITPLISDIMMKMDAERCAVGKKLSLNLIPTLEQLKTYYGDNDSRSLFEYVHSPESPYKDLVGDHVHSRYLTEDVPYLVAPFVHLARRLGVPVQVSETCIRLASLLHGTDYFTEGTTLEKIGLENKPISEIIRCAS